MTQTALHGKQLKKVLIVEDEGDMCLLLNIMLNGKEMELDHVKNLKAAEEYLQKEKPSVVILDNKLPDGFGVDFISTFKRDYPAIKIIMISGYDGAAKDVALDNGADIYLEKPFTKDQLFQSIKGLMSETESAAPVND
jgi:two-component system, OmpR family, response regulator